MAVVIIEITVSYVLSQIIGWVHFLKKPYFRA